MDHDSHKEIVDGLYLCAGATSSEHVILYTADKSDAEWLYAAVEPVAAEREMEKMDNKGLHREYYLELAQSDEHSLDDEDAFNWNTRPVYQVVIEPTDYCIQRLNHWFDGSERVVPRDFTFTPLIAEIIYRAGAHEVAGRDAPQIEFDAVDTVALEDALDELGIDSIHVGDLWHLDEEASARFRAYAGIERPEVVDYDDR